MTSEIIDNYVDIPISCSDLKYCYKRIYLFDIGNRLI